MRAVLVINKIKAINCTMFKRKILNIPFACSDKDKDDIDTVIDV